MNQIVALIIVTKTMKVQNVEFFSHIMLDFAEQHPTNLRNPKGREGKPKLLPSETQHFSSDESDDGSYDNGTVLIVHQQHFFYILFMNFKDSKRGKAPPPQPVRNQQLKPKNITTKSRLRPALKPLQPDSDQEEEQDYENDFYDGK